MKTITRRQLSREPGHLKRIKPGESVHVPDEQGGLIVSRGKPGKVTASEMFEELEKLASGCPPLDTLALSRDET